MNSIDIVLNAIDSTGPAVNSAIGNMSQLGNAAESINSGLGDIASGASSGIASLLAGIFSVPGALAVAAAGAVAFGAAMVTNIGGARDVVVDFASGVWDIVTTVTSNVWQTVSEFFGGISKITIDWTAVFNAVVKGIVTGFAVIEYTFRNFGDVAELVWTSTAYGLVRLANEIEYYFTKVIPAWLDWFALNWKDVLDTILKYIGAVITNAATNLYNFFAAVVGWMKGDGFDFQWTALTEGFESSIRDLPVILAREIGPLESALADSTKSLGEKIGFGMEMNIQKRVAQIPEMFAAVAKGWDVTKNFVTGGGLMKLIGGVFGDDAKKASLALPGLTNERFTTGVQAGGTESIMRDMLVSQKKTEGYMEQVAGLIKSKIPQDIRDNVKTGVEMAKSNGLIVNP